MFWQNFRKFRPVFRLPLDLPESAQFAQSGDHHGRLFHKLGPARSSDRGPGIDYGSGWDQQWQYDNQGYGSPSWYGTMSTFVVVFSPSFSHFSVTMMMLLDRIPWVRYKGTVVSMSMNGKVPGYGVGDVFTMHRVVSSAQYYNDMAVLHTVSLATVLVVPLRYGSQPCSIMVCLFLMREWSVTCPEMTAG